MNTASKRLLPGTLVLPLLLAACSGAGGGGEQVDGLDDAIVTENANDKIAFDYFVSKGLTDVQAAGIVGNLDQESGMDPKIWQYGGGPGRGIAQWSAGGRWDKDYHDNVSWYAAQHGASIYSLDLQLDFIWYELTEIGYGYSELRAAKTVAAAEAAFQSYYEICGACDASNRLAHAQAALSDFGGSSPPPPSQGGCAAGGLYCGGDKVSGDASTLYRCNGSSAPTVVEKCAAGCQVNAGSDDACKPSGGSCVSGGLYCGGDKVSGDASTLYRCDGPGAPTVVAKCSDGCEVVSGQDDACRGNGSCVVGGLYCGGDKVSGDPETLYKCTGGSAGTVVEHCASGCAVRSGQNDACK